MATAHARKRTGRTLGSKAHSGQLHGSARKLRRKQERWADNRLARAHLLLAEVNKAQQRQNQVRCQIIVNGLANWQDAYKDMSFSVRPSFVKHFGASRVPALEFFAIEAKLYRDFSFERSVISDLLSRGYQLEELEVEFDSRAGASWGVCVWQKDHPSYHNPSEQMRRLFPKASPKAWSLLSSVFKTQHAGEQKHGMLSTQMAGLEILNEPMQILLHKALVFRCVVLSRVSGRPELAKAA